MCEDNRRPAHEAEPQLTEALHEYISRLDIPDGEAAWLRMERRIGRQRRLARWRGHMRTGVIVASLMLAVNLLFMNVNPAEAITRYYFKLHRQHDVTSVMFGNNDVEDAKGMLTDPPPEEDWYGRTERSDSEVPPTEQAPPSDGEAVEAVPSNRLEFASVEEAQLKAAFPIRTPAYMPSGWELRSVLMFQPEEGGKSGQAILEYGNVELKTSFMLRQEVLTDSSRSAITLTDPNASVREVEVGGGQGFIMTSGGRIAILQWMTDSMSYMINGMLTEEEIIDIANSLK